MASEIDLAVGTKKQLGGSNRFRHSRNPHGAEVRPIWQLTPSRPDLTRGRPRFDSRESDLFARNP